VTQKYSFYLFTKVKVTVGRLDLDKLNFAISVLSQFIANDRGSISSTFFAQLLRTQIPKALKDTDNLPDSYAFGSYVLKSCA